jgi:hypothetical protein
MISEINPEKSPFYAIININKRLPRPDGFSREALWRRIGWEFNNGKQLWLGKSVFYKK